MARLRAGRGARLPRRRSGAAGATAGQRRVDVRAGASGCARASCQPIAVAGDERVAPTSPSGRGSAAAQMPITSAATTTMPNTQVSRPWMSRTCRLVLRLVERPEHQLLVHGEQVHRRQDDRAWPRWRASSVGAGKKPAMPARCPGLVGGEGAEQHQELADEAAQAGQADRGQHDHQEAARRTPASCAHRPPKSASLRVWRRS